MNTAHPIRNPEDLEQFKGYYQYQKPHPRNYLLIISWLKYRFANF